MGEIIVPEVYKAIVAVALDISKTGIGKNRQNEQQKYKFRGIDDVYNEIAPLLAKHGLCILPRVLSRQSIERATKTGGVLFYVTVDMEFDFVAASDGSKHIVRTFGEAMDSGDKATNKAMSAAYKYAAFQAFCIPTEGDNDADAKTHEVGPAPELDAAILAMFEAAQTMEELGTAWSEAMAKVPVGLRHGYVAPKDAAKARIVGAG